MRIKTKSIDKVSLDTVSTKEEAPQVPILGEEMNQQVSINDEEYKSSVNTTESDSSNIPSNLNEEKSVKNELLEEAHIYYANEEFEFYNTALDSQFNGRAYTQNNDSEVYLECKEIIYDKKDSKELGITLSLNSKGDITNPPLENASNDISFPVSLLITNGKLTTALGLKQEEPKRAEDMDRFVRYVHRYMKFDDYTPINVDSPLKREDESDEDYVKRVDFIEKQELKYQEEYLEKNINKTYEHVWSLLEKFAEEFNAPKNKVHVDELNKYILELERYVRSEKYKGIPLPKSFSTDGNYLFFVKEKQSKAEAPTEYEYVNLGPLATIKGKSHSIGSADFVDIVYRNNGTDQHLVCRIDEIMDNRKILGLAEKGFVVKSNSAGYYTNYFMELLALDDARLASGKPARIKRMHAATKNGFYDNGLTFVYGNNTITRVIDPETKKPKRYRFTNEDVAKRYVQKGKIEKQLEGLKRILKNDPVVFFKMWATAASPLCKLLNLEPIAILHKGNSRSGKTILLKGSASLWGNPDDEDGLIATSGSIAGFEGIWEEQTCTFHGINEFSLMEAKAKKGQNVYKEVLYTFNEKKNSAKSNKGYENMRPKSWHGVLLINGENKVLKDSDNVGMVMRLIVITKEMIRDADAVRDFQRLVVNEGNNGHVMPLYMKKIVDAGKSQIREDFTYYLRKFTEVIGDSNTRQSLAQNFAVIAVAAKYLNQVFEENGITTIPPFTTILELVTPHLETSPDEPMGKKAARIYLSWLHENELRFNKPDKKPLNVAHDGQWETYKMSNDNNKSYLGFYKNGYVCHFTTNIRKVLEKELGFEDATTILEAWRDDKITECDNGKIDVNRKIDDDGKMVSKRYVKFAIADMEEYTGTATEILDMNIIDSEDNPRSKFKEMSATEHVINSTKDIMMLNMYKKAHPEDKTVIQGAPYVREWFEEYMGST